MNDEVENCGNCFWSSNEYKGRYYCLWFENNSAPIIALQQDWEVSKYDGENCLAWVKK